ncbi:YceI family protein [Sediminibacter sp. Hel_I_10]|uniref:YceI family protein n=1 Tax=Sediminibacter sp. Hel_I_10 TaxID=1392490 RepID=UPI00047B03A1|nr:YceI family protein [Sediminibacter sp. Hel_I_10]
MKKTSLQLLHVLIIALVMTSCQEKAEKANTSDAEAAAVSESTSVNYTVNVTDSQIEWKGFKPTGTHTGTIKIDNGNLTVDDGRLQSGTFVIDMESIEVTDLEGDDKMSLESHLKGTVEGKEGDFFNVNQFPEATFEVTSTESLAAGKSRLSGNLSMKGQKHNISFPVTISNEDGVMKIESEPFTIDRTQWGINYGSKSVFDNLGDQFINDDMELKIMIKAKKA